MPSGPRIRTDNVFGTTTDNPLLIGATTINSAGLANLAAVSSAHAILILDPLRAAGAPEIVVVTAHTASATSATITRGAYGSTARQHASGTLWVHAPTREDFIQILTSSTRPTDPYQGQLIYETDTDTVTARAAGSVWQTVVPLGAWTSYTPTLTQSVAVAKTVTRATYTRIGRLIQVWVSLAATGAGTAANKVTVSLPVTAAAAGTLAVGSGFIFDASANVNFPGITVLDSTTTMAMLPADTNAVNSFLGVASFTAALASGDAILMSATFEAAT